MAHWQRHNFTYKPPTFSPDWRNWSSEQWAKEHNGSGKEKVRRSNTVIYAWGPHQPAVILLPPWGCKSRHLWVSGGHLKPLTRTLFFAACCRTLAKSKRWLRIPRTMKPTVFLFCATYSSKGFNKHIHELRRMKVPSCLDPKHQWHVTGVNIVCVHKMNTCLPSFWKFRSTSRVRLLRGPIRKSSPHWSLYLEKKLKHEA